MSFTCPTRKTKAGFGFARSWVFFLPLIAVLAMLVPCSRAQSDFTIIALPDTQYYSESYPQTFTAQTQWIVDNAATLNIQGVVGLGDIVNTAPNIYEWQNADASVKLLDSAHIPYFLAIGNHDYSDSADTSGRTSETANFNAYFGPARYQNYSWYKGQYPAGSNENFYGILTINGKQYLFLMLEFYPRDAALAWATSVIATNPMAEVIVVTHSYLYIDSTRVSLCDSINAQTYNVGADNDGESLWKKFVSKYSQISLVLNGHFAWTDSTAEGVGKRTDLGDNGNIVNQMLSDYQEMPNGGNGYLRILTFRPSLNLIEVSTYSPTLNSYLTDSANQFSVQWHSTGTPPTGAAAVTGIVQSVGCSPLVAATISTTGTSTSSNSSGNFTLNVTAPATYTVTAQASGYSTSTDFLSAWVGFPAQVKYFLSTQPPGSLSGQVTNTSGAGISGATVWYSGGIAKTDSNGNYSFASVPTGTYTVTGSQSGYQTASNQNVSVSSGVNAVSNLVLTATSTGTISGTVTSATGTAIANATISYSGGSATSTTNAAGAYTLTVVPGTYTVTAAATGFVAASQQNVSVTPSTTTTANFVLMQAGTISGTVTSTSGSAISNATVSYSGGSATATTNSSGAYTLSVAPGTYSVTASASGYQAATQQNVSVTVGTTTTINFNLAQSVGTISGTVTSASGTGIANATVSYSGGSATATTNSSGAYTLSVPPGTYSVTASATGYQASTQQNVSVSLGATTTVNFMLSQVVGTGLATIQFADLHQSGQTSLSLAFPSTPTAGNTLIVVGISSGLTGTTLTVSDNNNQTWQSAYGYVTNPSSNGQVKVWYVSNCVARPTTVTVSIGSTSHNIHAQIFEVSGLAPNPVDVTGSADSGASSVISQTATTSSAVTQGLEYSLAVSWTWNCSSCTPTITKDPNYTILQQAPNPSGGDFVLSQARVQNAASGVQTASFSSSIAYQYATVLLSFKGGAGNPNGTIAGNVTDGSGTAIANATVSYSGGSTTATTNSSGAYTLSVAPGTYSVTASAAGYQPSTQQNVSVTSGFTATTNFSLSPLIGTISGTVTSSTGAVIPNATVSYSGGSTTATSNSSGAYTLNVAPGTYSVTATTAGYQSATWQNVTVTNGTTTTLNVVLTQLGTISGTVTTSTGAGIANATVSYSGGSATATTNASGAYTLSVPPGTYSVTVTATGYQTSTQQNVTVTSGATTTSNFSLSASVGTISGTVTSAAGAAIANATVSYSGGTATATTNSSGAYTLSVAPGTYNVTATATGYQSSTQQNVTVTIGTTTTVNFSLVQSAGTVSGKVTNASGVAIANASISYSGGTTTATTNSAGSYSLNVAPGTYSVTATATGYQSSTQQNVTVTVGTTTTVNFSLVQSTGTISGTVTSSTGAAIANATVSYSGGTATATTNSSGAYTLSVAPGTYNVTATATGYQSSTQQNVTVTIGTTTTVNFSLVQSTGTISGTVTSSTGTAIANATVSYSGGTATATTNSSGAYSLSVAPGTYTVTASAIGYLSSTQQNVAVTAGTATTVNFSLPLSGGTGMTTVQAFDKHQSSSTSMSIAFPVTPTAGNTLIVVGISSGITGTSLTVSDNNNQTWQSAFAYVTNPNTNGQVKVWFVTNCVGLPTTVTVSIGSASHNIHAQIFEVSGIVGTPVDVTGNADSGKSPTKTQTVTSTGAVTQPQEYTLATSWTWNCSTCNPTITKDPNYSILLQAPNPTGGDFVLSQARIQTTASGKQSASFTSSLNYQYASVLVSFK